LWLLYDNDDDDDGDDDDDDDDSCLSVTSSSVMISLDMLRFCVSTYSISLAT
jgi:hypothetical protein